jgi:hypothetical protein
VCSRTLSGAFQTTYWSDSGAKSTVVGIPTRGMWTGVSASSVLVPAPGSTGYTVIPAHQMPDGIFNAIAVPVGSYFLRVDGPVTYVTTSTGQVAVTPAKLYPFTTSAPTFTRVTAARPDVVYPTAPTTVTLNLTNMAPWTADGQRTEVLVNSSQGGVSIAPLYNQTRPAVGATSYSAVFDWSAATTSDSWMSNGLPSASLGDVLYVAQRQYQMVGTGASAASLVIPVRFARLSTYSAIANGGSATIDAPLTPVTSLPTVAADMRPSAFNSLLPDMAPGGVPDPTATFTYSIFSSPHTVLGPDQPDTVARNGFLMMPEGAPDTDYGSVPYADFLDALWSPYRMVVVSGVAPVAAPGANSASLAPQIASFDAVSPSLPSPVVPLIGPVQAPLVAGQDARTNIATPVGLQPVISWAPPMLGTASSYSVGISELVNDAGNTVIFPVMSANVFGLSFQVPPGFLKAGSTYVASITAEDRPWDVLDGNPWGQGAPMHSCDRYTGTFTP